MCKYSIGGLTTTLMCRQRTILNEMVPNNLQRETGFDAKENSQTNENLTRFQRIKFVHSRVGFRGKSNFFHDDFVQFGKQHSRFKANLPPIVLSQQCCEVCFVSLTVVNP